MRDFVHFDDYTGFFGGNSKNGSFGLYKVNKKSALPLHLHLKAKLIILRNDDFR